MELTIYDLIDCLISYEGSDLHLSSGCPPLIRVHGELQVLDCEPLSSEDIKSLCKEVVPNDKKEFVDTSCSLDFGFSYGVRNCRLRGNMFLQKGLYGAVFRLIGSKIFSLDDIGLKKEVRRHFFASNGLYLVTGPTGSGKTSTMNSILDILNQKRKNHIVTVEDPIEFYHTNKKCIISQREVGRDVMTFANSLREALRQDPDVLFIGEMRDPETIALAVTAAETGHLVFGTLHTIGTADTISRIIDVFPSNGQNQIRSQLSSVLRVVISQKLLVRRDKPGRIANLEILIANDSVKSLIRENKLHQISSYLQTGSKEGMISFDIHLTKLYQEGVINQADLLSHCIDKGAIQAFLVQNS